MNERGPRFDDQPPMIRMRVNPEETLPVVLPYGQAAPSVDIVIPVHNEWHVLRPCLESVEAFTSYPRARIVILDDGRDRKSVV